MTGVAQAATGVPVASAPQSATTGKRFFGACCQEPSSVACLRQRFLAVAAVELREVDRHLRGGLRLFLLSKGHGWPKR